MSESPESHEGAERRWQPDPITECTAGHFYGPRTAVSTRAILPLLRRLESLTLRGFATLLGVSERAISTRALKQHLATEIEALITDADPRKFCPSRVRALEQRHSANQLAPGPGVCNGCRRQHGERDAFCARCLRKRDARDRRDWLKELKRGRQEARRRSTKEFLETELARTNADPQKFCPSCVRALEQSLQDGTAITGGQQLRPPSLERGVSILPVDERIRRGENLQPRYARGRPREIPKDQEWCRAVGLEFAALFRTLDRNASQEQRLRAIEREVVLYFPEFQGDIASEIAVKALAQWKPTERKGMTSAVRLVKMALECLPSRPSVSPPERPSVSLGKVIQLLYPTARPRQRQ